MRRLVRVTLGDLIRSPGAEDLEERGVGVPLGLARTLLAELGVFAATFYDVAVDEQGGGQAAAEVVQQMKVLGSNLLSRDPKPRFELGVGCRPSHYGRSFLLIDF